MAATLETKVNRSRTLALSLLAAVIAAAVIVAALVLSGASSRSVAASRQQTITAAVQKPAPRQLEPRAEFANPGRRSVRQLEPRSGRAFTDGTARRLDRHDVARFRNSVDAPTLRR